MKRRFTLEEHRHWGQRLKAIRDELQQFACLVSNRYPHASKEARAANQVYQQMDGLRCVMDDAVFRENPGTDGQSLIRVYYPGQDASQEVK